MLGIKIWPISQVKIVSCSCFCSHNKRLNKKVQILPKLQVYTKQNYNSGKREGHMNVIEDSGTQNELSYPIISGIHDVERANYTEGSVVSLTCESTKMKPAPR